MGWHVTSLGLIMRNLQVYYFSLRRPGLALTWPRPANLPLPPPLRWRSSCWCSSIRASAVSLQTAAEIRCRQGERARARPAMCSSRSQECRHGCTATSRTSAAIRCARRRWARRASWRACQHTATGRLIRGAEATRQRRSRIFSGTQTASVPRHAAIRNIHPGK